MTIAETIRRLEELTLNTSPAIHQSFYDGWVLRASGTDTRRANSVTALQSSQISLGAKIAYCEEWYRAHGQLPIFRLTEFFSPPELDLLLAQRGYSREVQTYVMTVDLANEAAFVDIQLPAGAKIVERSEDEGLADVHRLRRIKGELHDLDAMRQALWRGKQLFVSLRTVNGLASTGMARIEDGHLGIFNMRTAERARGKGYATMLVSYLITWGQAQGATKAFLQVDEANQSAVAVYRKFGFKPEYSYWHRVAPKPEKAERSPG